jgi:hypothetical protein
VVFPLAAECVRNLVQHRLFRVVQGDEFGDVAGQSDHRPIVVTGTGSAARMIKPKLPSSGEVTEVVRHQSLSEILHGNEVSHSPSLGTRHDRNRLRAGGGDGVAVMSVTMAALADQA